MFAAEEADQAAEFFKALSDPTRLRIVALLSHGELCVCHLVAALDLPQSTVSRQLGVLRHSGLVQARREGTWIHYALAPQSSRLAQSQLAHLARELSKEANLRADVARLLRTRGPGQCS